MKTPKSAVEIEMINLILDMEEKIDQTNLTIEDGKQMIRLTDKCLTKCEELRKSRDNWRIKFENKI